MPASLHSLNEAELTEQLAALDEKPYRAGQVLDWIWKKRVSSIEEMTNLPAALREKLSASFHLGGLAHAKTQGSGDSTRKFLFRLRDGPYVECVLIPASPALYGERADRRTLCVSSQVGCAYGCKFCASGLDGFTRNLDPGEIAGQILLAEELSGEKVNIARLPEAAVSPELEGAELAIETRPAGS